MVIAHILLFGFTILHFILARCVIQYASKCEFHFPNYFLRYVPRL